MLVLTVAEFKSKFSEILKLVLAGEEIAISYEKNKKFELEPLHVSDCSNYHHLKAGYLTDPFDRMLIWTAISNNYIFISAVQTIKKYVSQGLRLFK